MFFLNQFLPIIGTAKTTRCRCTLIILLLLTMLFLSACSAKKEAAAEHEEEVLSRTEFTKRVENFFEFDPLKAGKESNFLIHLTDLSDGTPVEKAEVTLLIRNKSGAEVGRTIAKVGRVTGIYVAAVEIPQAGDYDIEFRIKNQKLDERMPLADFKVE